MDVTLARPSDSAALRALHSDNWRRDYRGLVPDDALLAPLEGYMDAKWGDGAGNASQTVCVIRDAIGLTGFASFDDQGTSGVFLDNLHVASRARGQGIGRRLMSHVAQIAGVRPLWLYVLAGNHAARAIYANWGGQESAVVEVPFLDGFVQEHRVSWEDGTTLWRRLNPSDPQ